MKTIRITMMAATLFAAGLAAAADATPAVLHGEDSGSFHFGAQPAASTLTRAEVLAAAAAARHAGVSGIAEDSGSFHLAQQRHESVLTRAEVVAAMLAARHSGEMLALTGEDSGSFRLARHPATDDARTARRARTLPIAALAL